MHTFFFILSKIYNYKLFQIVARYKTDVSSRFELILHSNFSYQLFYHGFKCSTSLLDSIDLHTSTISTLLHTVSTLHVCSGKIFQLNKTADFLK